MKKDDSISAVILKRAKFNNMVKNGNLLLFYNEFDNPYFTKLRSSVTPNATTSPIGNMTADAIIEDTTATNTHHLFRNITKATTQLQYTNSLFVKTATRTRARLVLYSTFGAEYAYNDFNLTTGTSTINRIGTGWTNYTGNIINIGNGWYRVWVTALSDTVNNVGFQLYLQDASGNLNYTGNGISGMYIWGANLKLGGL